MTRYLPAAVWTAMTLVGLAAPANATGLYCRVSATPWLGCAAADQTEGAACACPTDTGVAAGQIGAAQAEDVFALSSESTKLALGVSGLSGPVTAFVPRALSAHRDQAQTASQQQLLQIYDFFQFKNFAPEAPAAVLPPPAPPPPGDTLIQQLTPPAGTRPHTRGISTYARPPLTPARAFLHAQDVPPPGIGAYGILAFTGRPTPASQQRLAMACQSFLASLPAQNDLPATITPDAQMLTIWPVTGPIPHGDAASDCPALLNHYDLYGGLSAIRDARAQGNRLTGRGPFLIGWSPSSSRYATDAVVLVIDMSAFETQDSFDSAFLFWQQRIVQDPTLWRSGFARDGIRLAIRDFADHYGSAFLSAFKIGGE